MTANMLKESQYYPPWAYYILKMTHATEEWTGLLISKNARFHDLTPYLLLKLLGTFLVFKVRCFFFIIKKT